VRRGGFADWLRAQGKLGGQHKVPRMDNDGQLTRELSAFLLPPSPSVAAGGLRPDH
jgi:hypothetical protein